MAEESPEIKKIRRDAEDEIENETINETDFLWPHGVGIKDVNKSGRIESPSRGTYSPKKERTKTDSGKDVIANRPSS